MAARYPQEFRDRALGMLMASATEHDGEWKAQFGPTSRELGVSKSTLFRWWRDREMKQDDTLRNATTRARETVRDEGAETWLQSVYRRSRDISDRLLGELDSGAAVVVDSDGEPVTDRHGNPIVVDIGKVDAKARALKIIHEIAPGIESGILGNTDAAGGPRYSMAQIEDRARRAGLLPKKGE